MSMLMEELEVASERKLFKSKPMIEIVTHCYAAELPHYAACLVAQASSLVLHKPKQCRICLSICYTNDPTTRRVVEWATETLLKNGVDYTVYCIRRDEIGRRCIGRNLLALRSKADIVWFADVDHVFRDGVFDRLAVLEWPKGASMIYPREIMIHRDWATGDKFAESIDLDNPRLMDVDPAEFIPKRYRKAIGGVQIVQGYFARKHGYLDRDERWQRPAEKPFGDFRDDVAYRSFCLKHGSIVGVDLPGMYRVRHSRTTYQEDKK